jgi:hypothetical protein
MSSPLSGTIPALGWVGVAPAPAPLHPVGIGNTELNQEWTGKRYFVPPYLRPSPPLAGWAWLLLPPPSSGGYWQYRTEPDMDMKSLCHPLLSGTIPSLGWVGVAPAPAPFIRWVLAI